MRRTKHLSRVRPLGPRDPGGCPNRPVNYWAHVAVALQPARSWLLPARNVLQTLLETHPCPTIRRFKGIGSRLTSCPVSAHSGRGRRSQNSQVSIVGGSMNSRSAASRQSKRTGSRSVAQGSPGHEFPRDNGCCEGLTGLQTGFLEHAHLVVPQLGVELTRRRRLFGSINHRASWPHRQV